jgi:hypothetical protein
VSLEKFVNRLRREVIANPKKGAILGVMFLVAIYFWAPLVMGWMGAKETISTAKPGDPAPGVLAGLTAQSTPAASEGPAVVADIPWHVVAEWMDRDPLKQTAMPRAVRRDPFRESVEVVSRREPSKPESVKKLVAPESLKLNLTGTVLGAGRSVAVIDGRSYREGDEVRLAKGDSQLRFKLVEVRADRVVLLHEGKRIEVRLRSRPSASHIELMGKNE